MGEIKPPEKAILFCSIIFNMRVEPNSLIQFLTTEWGDIFFESETLEFSHTHYYEKEMGAPLYRKFLFFRKNIDLETVYRYKLRSNEIENMYKCTCGRNINIDPGYMTLSKVCLLTTKNYSHRVYLQKGIYAEVTLYFKKGHWQPYSWTYPDYAGEEIRRIFYEARGRAREYLG